MKPRKPNYYNQQNLPERNQPQKSQLPRKINNPKTTSWGVVSEWYDDYLKDEDNYQHKVILPNLLRLINTKGITKKTELLDLGCGQGFFIEKLLAQMDVKIHGVDLASKLIAIAEQKFADNKNVSLKICDASKMPHLKDNSIDIVYSVLALQNMADVDKVVSEIQRVLKKGGHCIFVINHPSFRIPKESDWKFDMVTKKQGRVVYNYMTDKKYVIDMNPGRTAQGEKGEETISFHHPLQYFSKIFNKHDFAISRIEEWISHKKSEEGARQKAEDDARKEIPMFMCLDLISVAK